MFRVCFALIYSGTDVVVISNLLAEFVLLHFSFPQLLTHHSVILRVHAHFLLQLLDPLLLTLQLRRFTLNLHQLLIQESADIDGVVFKSFSIFSAAYYRTL